MGKTDSAKGSDACEYGPHRLTPWTQEELRAASESLPPFETPPNGTVPNAFRHAPPRPIPDSVKRGSFLRHRRFSTRAALTIAVVFLLASFSETIQEWSSFVLILRFLPHIAVGLIALVGLNVIIQHSGNGTLAYARMGEAVPGRVLTLGSIADRPDDQLDRFRLAVGVEYRSPDDGRMVCTSCTSKEITRLIGNARYSTSLEQGDYIPLVGLPGRFDKTVRLYGFLGLHPDYEYVRKNGVPALIDPSATGIILLVPSLVMIFVVLPMFMFTMGVYGVIGGSYTPHLVGTLGVAISGAGIGLLVVWRSPSSGRNRNRRLGGAFCGLVFGALAGFAGTLIANALLDRSSATYQEIEVVDWWQKTWYPFFVREYSIEYREFSGGRTRERWAHPEKIEAFGSTPFGIAEIGQGAFGMHWVRNLHPLGLYALSPDATADEVVFSFDMESDDGKTETVRMGAFFVLPDGTRPRPSEAMLRRLRYDMTQGT